MTILYIGGAIITFSNDEVDIDCVDALSVSIDEKVKFEGTLDRRSGVLTPTRSANINEPIMITIVFDSQCGTSDGSTVIDKLHALSAGDMANRGPRSKGVLKIVDTSTNQTRTFDQAILANNPEYDARTITRGGTTATYTAEFLTSFEIIN